MCGVWISVVCERSRNEGNKAMWKPGLNAVYRQHSVHVDHKVCERSRNVAPCDQCNAGIDNCVPDKNSDMVFSDHCKESVDKGACKVKPVASQDSITVDEGIGARGKSYNPSRLQAVQIRTHSRMLR